MAVLLVLVENADRVVARDMLLARVWPDTLPTNDVVTQAITQLRKALGEAQDTIYIETIAKSGYRLLAAVERIEPPTVLSESPRKTADTVLGDSAIAPAAGPTRLRGSYPMRHAMVSGISTIALLLAVAVLWAYSIGSDPGRAVPTESVARLQTRMITSAPGFELAPALSPDAAMVAYMAVPPGERSIAIMVQTTAPTAPRQLTHPGDAAHDGNPQWSPDGREIAFLRVQAGSGCKIMITPANGGAERSVGDCDLRNLPGFDWTPDGNGLIFGSHGSHGGGAGLQLLDLNRGQWTGLPYGARPEDFDRAPRFSPDGRWIVFVRHAPLGDFWRVPAAGGTAERLTHMAAEIRGWDWANDGASLIYGRRHESESRIYRLDLRDGTSTDLGIVDGEYPVVAAQVPGLAYVDRRSYFGIHRVDLDTSEGDGNAERLFASSGRDRLPSVAPDGQQLVFMSDRSGEFGLWWADLGQRAPRLIPGVRPESRYIPSWSPDSRRVLLEGAGPAGANGIFEVIPGSGQVSKLPVPRNGPVQALYLPDVAAASRLLVIAGGAGGRLDLTLFDRSVSPWRELGSIDRVSLAQVDPVGRRVVFTRPGEAGLWQADLQLSAQSVRRLNATSPATSRYQAWTVAADGNIFTTSWRADCPALLTSSEKNTTSGRARCLHRGRRSARTGFSISVRTGEAFVSLVEWEGGDIGFVMLGKAPGDLTLRSASN